MGNEGFVVFPVVLAFADSVFRMGNGALQIGNEAFRIVAGTFRIVVVGRNRRN